MKLAFNSSALRLAIVAAASGLSCAAAMGQAAAAAPVVDTAVPIIIHAIKPHKASPYTKFEGTVMNANIAQITVRAKGNDLAIQTFPLSEKVSAEMQKIVDKGGYQYGDKVTVFYDPQTRKAMKIKGKPSKPI